MEAHHQDGGAPSAAEHSLSHSHSSSSSSSNGSNAATTPQTPTAAIQTPAPQPTPHLVTPKATTPRSIDPNPYPTTFVQADTSSFKQVVQLLTGSTETASKQAASASASSSASASALTKQHNNQQLPPAAKSMGPKKPAFKAALYERRSNLKLISPLVPAAYLNSAAAVSSSPRKQHQQEMLSPSVLDFPSLTLSPVTPLIPDPFKGSPHPNSVSSVAAEDRAIAEKGFYLHPSPRGAEPPRLLPLFPLTSPRAADSSA